MNERQNRLTLPTISEIGAVTVIIAVMAAAMVPAVVKARQQQQEAEQKTCLSNIKQLNLGILQYVQDYDETYPPAYKGAPQTWGGRIWPYVKSAQVFKCPTDPTKPDKSLDPPAVVVSYGLNSNMTDKSPDEESHPDDGLELKDVGSPANTVCFFEIAGAQVQVDEDDEGTSHYTKDPPSGCLSPSGNGERTLLGCSSKGSSTLKYDVARHNGGGNFGALDGHAKWSLPDYISTGNDNPSPTGLQNEPAGSAAGTGDSYYTLTFSVK